MTEEEAIDLCENYALGIAERNDERINRAIRMVVSELRHERTVTSREWAQRNEALNRIDSLKAKLEQSEHNCDMLLRYIDQALRDARQLQASLDDWKAEIPQDADTHRFRSTRAYQIVKSLETASLTERSARRDGATGAEMAGAENGQLQEVLDNIVESGLLSDEQWDVLSAAIRK